MRSPLLSIVIANYNYGRFLEEAIQSVLSQSYDDYELIIVDGGSTDNSVEIIKKYADKIAWWCSEKDKGQSDAFNKGFAHARGRFLTWLNADDVMLPGVVQALKEAVERYPVCDWFVGGCFWLDPQMRIVNCGRGRPFSELRYREGIVSAWGPSSFFTKRLLDCVGGVDVRFHYMMDSDLWLRFAYKANARYRPFCNYAWGLRLHPAAKMSSHNFTATGELVIGSHSQNGIEHKNFTRLTQERTWMREYFLSRPPSRLSRILSVSWKSVLLARLDLMRWKGCHYLEAFR